MRHLALVLSLAAALPLALSAQTPASPGTRAELDRMAGCTLQGRTYTCSAADVQRALSLSQSVSGVSRPPNHASDAVLADLIRHLGKTAAPSESASDLTFILEPLQQSGVEVGPGSIELARLRVLLSTPTGAPGKLLWVQTYRGDPSMPWPAIARATADALRDQLRSR